MAYDIVYAAAARHQLRALDAASRRRLLDAIENRLRHEPTRISRNRFQRRQPNPLSEWELREDPLRVFYDVEGDTVYIRAIGIKRRDRTYEPSGSELETDG